MFLYRHLIYWSQFVEQKLILNPALGMTKFTIARDIILSVAKFRIARYMILITLFVFLKYDLEPT